MAVVQKDHNNQSKVSLPRRIASKFQSILFNPTHMCINKYSPIDLCSQLKFDTTTRKIRVFSFFNRMMNFTISDAFYMSFSRSFSFSFFFFIICLIRVVQGH